MNNQRSTASIRYLSENKNEFHGPHEESNLDLRFRKPLFYPLNYGGEKGIFKTFSMPSNITSLEWH